MAEGTPLHDYRDIRDTFGMSTVHAADAERTIMTNPFRFAPMSEFRTASDEFFSRFIFEIGLKATDRWEAIRRMLDVMLHGIDLTHDEKQRVTMSVLKRESYMSTGIGYGVGLPHASAMEMPFLSVGFFIAGAPIEWEAADRQPVTLISCWVMPHGSGVFQKHLKHLAYIAPLLSRNETRTALLNADLNTFFRIMTKLQSVTP